MSVIFGVLKPAGQHATRNEVATLAWATQRYAPEGSSFETHGRIAMGFQSFHTTERSRFEERPARDTYGNLLVIDGRLDNHEGLRQDLGFTEPDVPDSQLVLAAFVKWGQGCFSRFIGDWALAFWSSTRQSLYLARDHAGTRTLYLQIQERQVVWSTYIDAFFATGMTQAIDEQYASRFLAGLPVLTLTPYNGIRAVPAAHYLILKDGQITTTAHWDWKIQDQLEHKTDQEYEEHFLSLFRQSVARRIGPGARILGQMSGGMDSTSIVCMADQIRTASGGSSSDLIDTLSFYDDSEPNWNERLYFSVVEAKRGKSGIHIRTSLADQTFESPDSSLGTGLYLWPGFDKTWLDQEARIQEHIASKNYKVILSGIGGDELLGGVPSPLPELADSLVRLDLKQLLKRATEWCVVQRSPLLQMLYETLKFALGLYWPRTFHPPVTPPWITPRLRKLARDCEPEKFTWSGPCNAIPSVVDKANTWWSIMETLPHLVPQAFGIYEYRYPYLDRDLVDFLFRIPRTQLLHPGYRRFLMRRALKGIVPREILERNRKGFIIRGPLASIQNRFQTLEALLANSQLAEYGFIEPQRFIAALKITKQGQDGKWLRAIIRTISYELWLRSSSRFLSVDAATRRVNG